MAAHSSSMDDLNEKRREAVRLRLVGSTLAEIKTQTGLSAPTVIAAHKAFLAGGWEGVALRKRGRSAGEGRIISPQQECELFRLMVSAGPDQLGLGSALWQVASMQALSQQKLNVDMPERSLSNYLRQ